MSLKHIAEQACSHLAGMIWESNGSRSLWILADRIEARFKIQGCTEAHLDRQNKAYEQFLAEECAKHDAANPNRLTYLHR